MRTDLKLARSDDEPRTDDEERRPDGTEEELRLLDCSVYIGRPSGSRWRVNAEVTARSLLAEMDRTGVRAAVAHHALAREYSPEVGNDHLAKTLPASDRLLRSWVLLPHHTGEFPAPDTAVQRMRAAGVVMARLHPATDAHAHRFLLAEWVVGPLLGALENAGLPLALDFHLFRRAEPPWAALHEVLRQHPRLNVILMNVQGRNNRTLYPFLEQHARVVVQAAGFNVHRGIEDFVSRFGAERMVFGSDYPEGGMGTARFHLETADIDADAKQQIASRTLESLLPSVPAEKEATPHV